MAYAQPIVFQVQPQQQKGSGFHPVVIIAFVIIAILIVGAVFYFLDQFFTPTAAALNSTVNITPATNVLHFAETSVDYGIIIIVMILGGVDALWQYLYPNRLLGIFNIAFLFLLGFMWLMVKIPLLAVISGIGISTIFPTLFVFMSSGYFLLFLAVCLILGIIFDFRGE